jgi:hypothetical protein
LNIKAKEYGPRLLSSSTSLGTCGSGEVPHLIFLGSAILRAQIHMDLSRFQTWYFFVQLCVKPKCIWVQEGVKPEHPWVQLLTGPTYMWVWECIRSKYSWVQLCIDAKCMSPRRHQTHDLYVWNHSKLNTYRVDNFVKLYVRSREFVCLFSCLLI